MSSMQQNQSAAMQKTVEISLYELVQKLITDITFSLTCLMF